MKKDNKISSSDLNTMIMSVVHDAKNSLLLSLSTLEFMTPLIATELHGNIDKVQTEISSVNQSLMRLLTLYKMQTDLFSLNRDQHNVHELLDDILLTNKALFISHKINLSIDCDETLEWFFDFDLLSNAMNTVLNNSIRYAKKDVVIKAFIKDNFLTIKIEDDGLGYPENMIDKNNSTKTKIDYEMSNSGLGLYFASTIAKLHHEKDLTGYTKTSNLESGGGCFAICIP